MISQNAPSEFHAELTVFLGKILHFFFLLKFVSGTRRNLSLRNKIAMNNLTNHNFSPDSNILAPDVLRLAAKALMDWEGRGHSIIGLCSNSKEYSSIMTTLELLVKELLQVPESHSILFFQGGKVHQFAMVAQAFLNKKAAYLDTGLSAWEAIQAASCYGKVQVIASSRDSAYRYIPDILENCLEADYLHITSANADEGTQIFDFRNLGIPLVCDMSADLFSRVIPIREFDLIYADAGKNIGLAGMTLVMIKNVLLDKSAKVLPSASDYRLPAASNRRSVSPPLFCLYTAMLNMIWLKQQGSITAIEAASIKKSGMLYKEIDRNPLFEGTAAVAHRSRVDIIFKLKDKVLEPLFLQYTNKHGFWGLERTNGLTGFGVSLSNAVPEQSVIALVELMRQFESSQSSLAKDTDKPSEKSLTSNLTQSFDA